MKAQTSRRDPRSVPARRRAARRAELTTTVPATAGVTRGRRVRRSRPQARPLPARPAHAKPSPSIAEAAPCVKRALKFDPKTLDLTGAWGGDDDGIYYIRQIGKVIWWSGMSGAAGPADQLGRDWNNVATGTIKDDLTIPVTWADVPRGQAEGVGTMVWEVQDDGYGNARLVKQSATGSGFGGTEFIPCAPG